MNVMNKFSRNKSLTLIIVCSDEVKVNNEFSSYLFPDRNDTSHKRRGIDIKDSFNVMILHHVEGTLVLTNCVAGRRMRVAYERTRKTQFVGMIYHKMTYSIIFQKWIILASTSHCTCTVSS